MSDLKRRLRIAGGRYMIVKVLEDESTVGVEIVTGGLAMAIKCLRSLRLERPGETLRVEPFD